MTRRDFTWRGRGVGVVGVAIAIGGGARGITDAVLGLPAFCLALLGIVLVVQGKRVPAALRIERSRHRMLAQAIRDRHRRRPDDGPPRHDRDRSAARARPFPEPSVP